MSLALVAPIRAADQKMDQATATDAFAAGMENMNNYVPDETKYRPVFILPRPYPV